MFVKLDSVLLIEVLFELWFYNLWYVLLWDYVVIFVIR